MANVDCLRTGYAKVGTLAFFGRMLDKIRLADQGKLPPGYNLGDQNPISGLREFRLVPRLPDLKARGNPKPLTQVSG
jgi:hypothetical protein